MEKITLNELRFLETLKKYERIQQKRFRRSYKVFQKIKRNEMLQK